MPRMLAHCPLCRIRDTELTFAAYYISNEMGKGEEIDIQTPLCINYYTGMCLVISLPLSEGGGVSPILQKQKMPSKALLAER